MFVFLNLNLMQNTDTKEYKVIEVKCINGIVYEVFEDIDGVFVCRGESPYKGNIIIPKTVTLDSGQYP